MKKNILLDSEKYNVIVNFLDQPSTTSLLHLYLPIVGYKAIFIYNYLINIYKIDKLSNIKKDNINELLSALGITIDEFASACSLLEATNLLQTYLNKTNKEQIKVTFILEKPLDYDSFMNNDSLASLLGQKISSEEKNQLRYIFNTNIISVNYENVSDTLDNIIDHEEKLVHISKNIDQLDKLSQEILIRHGKKVVLNKEIRLILTEAFKNNLLIFEHILNFVAKSLVCSSDNICYVDEKKLTNEIENYLSECNCDNKVIKRSYKIFNLNENLDNYKEVINDYNTYNCENYLISIVKTDISFETKKIFTFLKTKLNFSDAMINVLVDYCLIKNMGRIEPNYIYKIGMSINNIGLKTVEQIVKYIQHVSSNKRPNLDKIHGQQEDKETILTSDLIDW